MLYVGDCVSTPAQKREETPRTQSKKNQRKRPATVKEEKPSIKRGPENQSRRQKGTTGGTTQEIEQKTLETETRKKQRKRATQNTEKSREKQRNNHCLRSCSRRTAHKSIKINPADGGHKSKKGKQKERYPADESHHQRSSQSFAIVSIASNRAGSGPSYKTILRQTIYVGCWYSDLQNETCKTCMEVKIPGSIEFYPKTNAGTLPSYKLVDK
ncbi:hypothetical protein NC652_019304 [Populus alba x Populus x berolinensis]|nr:hypothetical protein NC652_019304 [Populus alba x Populus x berolinensis]